MGIFPEGDHHQVGGRDSDEKSLGRIGHDHGVGFEPDLAFINCSGAGFDVALAGGSGKTGGQKQTTSEAKVELTLHTAGLTAQDKPKREGDN
ncbi:MAG TPA: hypothetical protein VNH84_18010, partial [Candidatus Saccharimonadales bacterium]|nr:hypothetical protein [Candidatus Saccharimonadales bacterium]